MPRSPLPRLLVLLSVLIAVSPAAAFDLRSAIGGGERGNHDLTTVSIDVAACDEVLLKCGLDVDISFGDRQSVALVVDANLVDRYSIMARDGLLTIAANDHPRPSKGARLVVTLRALEQLAVEGSGDVAITGYHGPHLALDISGSGDVTLAGQADTLRVSVEGAGDVDAHACRAGSASVTVDGAGDVKVFARDHADVAINGVGDVDVYGNPPDFEPAVNGVGEVRRK
jgi:hypothetical protein